jgi:hypothetical protein
MANFGGFEVQTPQEVLAQVEARRRQVMTSGNVNAARSQNIESALDTLFGNPQARDAARRTDAMKRAQKAEPARKDGEDEVDYELRRLAHMRDAVADVSPDIAAQINTRLLELGEQKFQRQRLLAADARSSEIHNLNVQEKKDEAVMRRLTGGQTYVFDANTATAESYDLMNPTESAAFATAAKKPGARVITPAQAWQLYMQDDAQAAALRIALAKADQDVSGSKVTLKDVEKASSGLLDLYATADRVFQVFDTNPDVLTGGSAGAAALDKVATEIGAAGRMASGGVTKDGTSIDTWLKENSITNTRMQGLVVGLAYSLAKTNDPGGRLSDNDLRMAVQMVGGDNPNPAAILANLNDNLTARSQSLIDRIDTSDPATKDKMTARRDLLDKRFKSFQGRMQKWTQGDRGDAAAGTSTGPKVGDIVKGYRYKGGDPSKQASWEPAQ